MEKKAIIIFVRNPEPGKVKTRIAATMGKENALNIYKKLLEHTRSITVNLSCEKYVFYADEINHDDLWNSVVYHKRNQQGTDLGERMNHAFHSVFSAGCRNVLIVGSDCYELTQDHLEEAFEALHEADIVLGPASDGGYYLLGLKKASPELFTDMAWSSAGVFDETMSRIEQMHRRYMLLPVRNDVDEEKDLPVGWQLRVDS